MKAILLFALLLLSGRLCAESTLEIVQKQSVEIAALEEKIVSKRAEFTQTLEEREERDLFNKMCDGLIANAKAKADFDTYSYRQGTIRPIIYGASYIKSLEAVVVTLNDYIAKYHLP